MDSIFDRLQQKSLAAGGIGESDARTLYEEGRKKPFLLIAHANEIRQHFKGDKINLCAIVNAKSGICPQNCRFCAQSAHYTTGAPVYPLLPVDEILRRAREAKACGAHYFSIVTSGTNIAESQEWHEICEAVDGIAKMGLRPCGSLGMLTPEDALRLKEAGLYRYHHNLETSRSFFSQICSTHEYEEDIETLRIARGAGLSVCSGGIIGLGETMAQRIELAFTLKELDVDSVPLNILNPIKGTPLENTPELGPIEVLLTVALFRYILPEKDIRLCGGKEKNLRQLLPLGIVAGANSWMTGDYLTTAGRDSGMDAEMISDLGCRAVME